MKSTLAAFAVLAGAALSAPTPYPITIDSQSQAVPLVELYRANARTIRATFSDGGTASVITSQVPFFAWSTNLTSSTVVTANYEHVSGDTGKVDFSLAPADLNYTPGRYVYQAGLKTAAGNITVYRHGTLVIQGSPFATGAGTPTWTTNVNLALTTFVGTFPNANLDTNLQTLATPTPWRVFYSGAASNIVELPLGATNTVLTSSGVALAPTWAAGGGGSGDLTAVEVSGGLLTVSSGTGPVPTIGLTTGTVAGIANTNSDHGALSGLTDDDHVRYFDKDGSKAMTGNLDTGGNNILLNTGSITGGNGDFTSLNADTIGNNGDSIGLDDTLNGAGNSITNVQNFGFRSAGGAILDGADVAIFSIGAVPATTVTVHYDLDVDSGAVTNLDDEAYGAGWNADSSAASKNAVYDKVETIAGLPTAGATNTVAFAATSGGSYVAATNVALWFAGTIGGTNSVYVTRAGTNYHLRLE
jgi:hypothetical protein